MIGVLIPAHNEQALLAHCLHAVLSASAHPQLNGEPVRVLLVLDSCDDLSADIAAQYDVNVLAINARNVGVARATGAQWLLNKARAGFHAPMPTAAWLRTGWWRNWPWARTPCAAP